MLPELVTIPISHYGERARWALDHAGIDYREIHTLQMFSWLSAIRRGGKKTLPVLVLHGRARGEEPGVLSDSADIVRWASSKAVLPLYTASNRAEVEAFEDRLSRVYAVETRRLAYDLFMRTMSTSLQHNAGRAPRWQVAVFGASQPLVRVFARRYLVVNDDTVPRAEEETDRTMDTVAERLRDGRPFLFGETFGAADLAFAAFSAAVLLPERYPVPLPRLDDLPVELARRVRTRRAHPAGAFAMRMYDGRPQPRGTYERPLHAPR